MHQPLRWRAFLANGPRRAAARLEHQPAGRHEAGPDDGRVPDDLQHEKEPVAEDHQQRHGGHRRAGDHRVQHPEGGGGKAGEVEDACPEEVLADARARRAGKLDRVRHLRYGDGIVVESVLTRDDEEITVDFPGKGVRTLLGSLARLEVLG